VAFEFEESLAWLADVEDADCGGVLGEGGEEVGVMGGGGDAEEGRRVGQSLAGAGGGGGHGVGGELGCGGTEG
jgi:hypothetical protein